MAKKKKISKKVKRKPSLLAKIKALVPGKKATPGRAYKNALKTKKSTRLTPAVKEDPAHAPGHRHLSLKKTTGGKKNRPQNQAALNDVTRSERINQQSSNQLRVITGAAIGRSGRR